MKNTILIFYSRESTLTQFSTQTNKFQLFDIPKSKQLLTAYEFSWLCKICNDFLIHIELLNKRRPKISSRSYLTNIMGETKRVIIRVVIDFILLASLIVLLQLINIYGVPYKRGFFCDDESIKYPFRDSTVSTGNLFIVGLTVPFLVIVTVETVRWIFNRTPSEIKVRVFGRNIPTLVTNLYRYLGIFLFGSTAEQLTRDIAKYVIGRHRPYFYTRCQPIMNDGTNCSDVINAGRYIEDYKCRPDLSKGAIREMHLSFPSGHSSYAMFTMLYSALYLQSRMTWRGSKLLKHFIQFCIITWALFTCLTRISDYHHHWSDVLAGALFGIFLALFTGKYIAEFRYREQENFSNDEN